MLRIFLILCFGSLSLPFLAEAIEQPEQVLNQDVGIFTKLGSQVDLNLSFRDGSGRVAPLKDLIIPGKPIIIVPAYYKCPRLCGLVLDGVTNLINELKLKLGTDYSIVTISFDPTESPDLASETAVKFSNRITGPSSEGKSAWRFVVGEESAITAAMSQVGFKYMKDGKDFAHSAAIMILTPTGVVSQYFTGIEFSPWDVRLSLVEASKGALGSAVDHFLLFCFRFDPTKGKYTWAVFGLLKIVGALTLLGLAAIYYFFIGRAGHRPVQGTGR